MATPNDPSFSATAAFSPGHRPRELYARRPRGGPGGKLRAAEHADSRGGDLADQPAGDGRPGRQLTWDTESNLDLHVVDPSGAEIDWNDQSSEPPFSFAQVDGGSYGYIDYDSNANCLIDGLRREDAIWPKQPPSGQYTVRVDAASLCGQPIANWTVRAVLHGHEIARASGVALDADTMGPHGAGAGVLALQFSVP